MPVIMSDKLKDDILEYPGFFTWLLAADSVKENQDALIRVTKAEYCGIGISRDGDNYVLDFNSDFVPSVRQREERTEERDGETVYFGREHQWVMETCFKELDISKEHHDWLKAIGEVLFYRTSEISNSLG